ncbi:haloacid dehalogenase-like hydrolase [Reichenbachiella agarivorans]|uniref:Haloacid dehalogenase-like hydrolase n=1 Tax=Reichenbachiella agarivorans TaxID=2979464 RepID=A0ABY6CN39_9BACT|nr:HAD family hydrolase [Reichenbachiella agarivorans]UXP31926.1 haloacid dehalogenase-like hydrolase [Reichenbachiella agarivorans]
MKPSLYTILLAGTCLIFSCQPTPQPITEQKEIKDPLPSWNEGSNKTAIIDFVNVVTDDQNPEYVKPLDRIAVFDNDGTLWSEQPAYFQLFFAIDRIKAMASDHPEWNEQQPFKAVLEGDMKALVASGERGLIELVMTSHAGMTTDEFEQIVTDWIATAKHPRFDKPYNQLVYQPMLELLDYLRANEFKTFIVSGGGIEFMRPWAEAVYGIPKDQIVGSSIKTKFEIKEGVPQITRLPELDFIDDKEGKPVGIWKFIGRRPIFCGGNSDGDLQMMQYTASGKYKSMMLYVHHTDSVREWAYDRQSHIGQFDKGLDEAKANGWNLVNMKDDWNKVYPFD